MTIAGWLVVLGAFLFFAFLVYILSRSGSGQSGQIQSSVDDQADFAALRDKMKVKPKTGRTHGMHLARPVNRAFDPSYIDWEAIADEELQSYLPIQKINAIKRYRTLTTQGLKEAKEAVEYVIDHPEALEKAKTGGFERTSTKIRASTSGGVDWEAIADEELQSYLPHRKINAIKRYRELTGTGLKVAKEAVEYAMANPDKTKTTTDRHMRLIDTDGAGVRDLIAAGKIEEAAQVYAQFMGVDEYTARDAIEVMMAEDNDAPDYGLR